MKVVNFKSHGSVLSKKQQKEIQEEAVRAGGKVRSSHFHSDENEGVAVVDVGEKGEWKSAISKHVSSEEIEKVKKSVNAEPGDLLLFASGNGYEPSKVLGKYVPAKSKASTKN